MLPDYLLNFNEALFKFQEKYPRERWSTEFRNSLINDYSFYSDRLRTLNFNMATQFVF